MQPRGKNRGSAEWSCDVRSDAPDVCGGRRERPWANRRVPRPTVVRSPRFARSVVLLRPELLSLLFLWPTAFFVSISVPTPAAAQSAPPLGAELLRESIRLPTVSGVDGERALAEFLAQRLAGLGIEARVIDTPDPSGRGIHAALWARVEGAGLGRPVVLLSHLDVVQADAQMWQIPPFEGVIDETWVHGRGALDAKGVTVAHILALLALAGREHPIARDVILLATPGEETGGRFGAGYVARERPELLGNAEFLLTEGGGIRPMARGRSVWGVTVNEKSPCWLKVEAYGRPGHGSAPSPDHAVPRLVAALDRVRRIESPIRVLPIVEEQFAAMAPVAPPDDRAGFSELKAAVVSKGPFQRRFLANPGWNALVRNTVSITVLEGSHTTNVVPARAMAHLDARLLPGERCEDFTQSIRRVIADERVQVTPLLAFPSVGSSPETALFRAIERVAEVEDSEAIVVPRLTAGFTDAHWFRELGIVSYGFVPRRLSAADSAGIHGVDERVRIEQLIESGRLTARILEELPAGWSPGDDD